MKYSVLGRTGLKVSYAGLHGSWNPSQLSKFSNQGINLMQLDLLDLPHSPLPFDTYTAKAAENIHPRDLYTQIDHLLSRTKIPHLDLLVVESINKFDSSEFCTNIYPTFYELLAQGKVRFLGIQSLDLEDTLKYAQTGAFSVIQLNISQILTHPNQASHLYDCISRLKLGLILEENESLSESVMAEIMEQNQSYGQTILFRH